METTLRHGLPATPWPPAGLYGVVRTRGFFPWLVRRGTCGWADHAFVVVDDDGSIVEAEPGGVRRNHLDAYADCRIALNSGEYTTVEQRAVVAEVALSMLGRRYNDEAIIGDGLDCLGWHWRWLARHAAADGELVCSQLVAKAGAAAGLDWCCGRGDPVEVTPAMLAARPGMTAWSVPR